MSIYISGMSLPEQGFRTLLVWANGDVQDGNAQDIGKAIEVPPHGDLVDRDEIRQDWFRTDLGTIAVALVDIDGAKAIIPAEPGEDADHD